MPFVVWKEPLSRIVVRGGNIIVHAMSLVSPYISIASALLKCSQYWAKHNLQGILCLGIAWQIMQM